MELSVLPHRGSAVTAADYDQAQPHNTEVDEDAKNEFETLLTASDHEQDILKFFVGPFKDEERDLVSHIETLQRYNSQFFVSQFTLHAMLKGYILHHGVRKSIDREHYFVVLFVKTIVRLEKRKVAEELTKHFNPYAIDGMKDSLVVINLDRTCLYVSRLSQAGVQDSKVVGEINKKVKGDCRVVLCSLRPICVATKIYSSEPERKEQERQPSPTPQLLEVRDDSEDDGEDDSKDDKMTDISKSCRFAIVQILTDDPQRHARNVMQNYHQQYCFGPEETSRFELFGYDHNISCTLSRNLKCLSTMECIKRFLCVFFKMLLYPICVCCCFCDGKTMCAGGRQRSNSDNYDLFQERLEENPGRIFPMCRAEWRAAADENRTTCRATLVSIFLWVFWMFLLAWSGFGVSRYIVRDARDPLTFIECVFPIMGYISLCTFLSVWITYRRSGVNAYEHVLLYRNMLAYLCESPSEGETPRNDYRGLTALGKLMRISVIQFMYQRGMLESGKIPKSPLSNFWTVVWPLADPLTNHVTSCAFILQGVRYLINVVLVTLFVLSSLVESAFYNTQLRPSQWRFIGLSLAVSVMYFLFLMWMSATMFVRMRRYLNSIDALSMLLVNELANYYLPLENERNVMAWDAMRKHVVRQGDRVFSSIEINFIFVALGAFCSLTSAIWCYFYGRGVSAQVLSNSAFDTWLYLAVVQGISICRLLQFGVFFQNAGEELTCRLTDQRTEAFAQLEGRRSEIIDRLDNLIMAVNNVTVVPKLCGQRVDGFVWPTIVSAIASSVPSILYRVYGQRLTKP